MSRTFVCQDCRRRFLRVIVDLRRLPRASRFTYSTSLQPELPAGDSVTAGSPSVESRYIPINTSGLVTGSRSSPDAIAPKPARQPRPERLDRLATSTLAAVNAPAAYLLSLLKERTSSDSEIWTAFNQFYKSKDCPALAEPPLLDRPALMDGNVFRAMLVRITRQGWFPEPDGSLPSPSQIIKRYRELGIFRPEFYEDALWALLVPMVKRGTVEVDDRDTSSALLHYTELLRLWDGLLTEYSADRAAKPEQSGEPLPLEATTDPATWILPAFIGLKPDAQAETEGKETERTAISRLRTLLPSYPTFRIPSLSAAALATHRLLVHELPEAEDPSEVSTWNKLRAAATPFLQYITRILHRADASTSLSQLKQKFEKSPGGVNGPAQKFLANLSSLLQKVQPVSVPGGTIAWRLHPSAASRPTQLDHFKQKIGRGVTVKNEAHLQTLWHDIKLFYGYGPDALASQRNPDTVAIPPELYVQLLHAFCEIGFPMRAVEIWNFMIKQGIEPGVEHWSAMLEGCAAARDPAMVDEIWSRMRGSKLKLDAKAWGIYVNALFRLGRVETALQAMGDMGQYWTNAMKQELKAGTIKDISTAGSLPGAPKPNAYILNIALRWHLLQSRPDKSLTSKLLQWASHYGIRPDAYTYNALLHATLRQSNWQDLPGALKILHQLEASGLTADVHTLVMLIVAIMRSETLSGAKKGSMVNDILDGTKANKTKGQEELYAAIVDQLLSDGDNVAAAEAVVQYMATHNITIPSLVYTRLMRFHFYGSGAYDASLTPQPDVPAIEALLHQIKAADAPVDHRFYDALVQNYARAAMIPEAFGSLAKMSALGHKPSWKALAVLVDACAERGMWQRVQMIVHDARETGGLLPHGVKRSTHQVGFWRTCWRHGVKLEKGEVEISERAVRERMASKLQGERQAVQNDA